MMQNSIPQRKNCLISRYRDCERDMCMCTYSHILSTSMITIQCCHIDLQIQGENGILPQIFWNVKRRGPTHQPVLLLLSHCENNVHRYEYMKGKLGFIHRFWKKYHKIWMFITKKKITYKQECWWYLNLNYIYIYISEIEWLSPKHRGSHGWQSFASSLWSATFWDLCKIICCSITRGRIKTRRD